MNRSTRPSKTRWLPRPADNVTCGTGNDRVMADANDTYRIDCERIRVGLAGGPEPRSTSAPRERAARVP